MDTWHLPSDLVVTAPDPVKRVKRGVDLVWAFIDLMEIKMEIKMGLA